ncbi:hypothetical protein AGMMS49593_02250 [Endomicrobiia bacterium]|nr:hypothetical protein AGMMS49593_02250 [Endomicrobiia bacterium]
MTFPKKYINCSRRSIVEVVKPKNNQQMLTTTKENGHDKCNYSITNAYIYLNDFINTICTNFARSQCFRNGKWRNIIERQDDAEETHYRVVVTIETLREFTFGKQKYDNETFMKQLFQFSQNPYQTIFETAPTVSIVTNPIRIDLVTSDRALKLRLINVMDKNDIRLTNLKGSPTSKIRLVILEFFKPFYKDLLIKNSKGGIGSNYIQYPLQLQCKIKKAANNTLSNTEYNKNQTQSNKNRKFYSVARMILDLMALRDNGVGKYIRIDVIKCASSCFSSLVKRKGDKGIYISKKIN